MPLAQGLSHNRCIVNAKWIILLPLTCFSLLLLIFPFLGINLSLSSYGTNSVLPLLCSWFLSFNITSVVSQAHNYILNSYYYGQGPPLLGLSPFCSTTQVAHTVFQTLLWIDCMLKSTPAPQPAIQSPQHTGPVGWSHLQVEPRIHIFTSLPPGNPASHCAINTPIPIFL